MSGAADPVRDPLHPATGPRPIRVVAATYNIHSCIGTDGRYSPERIAEVLAELEADVIGLQEVDNRLSAGPGLDQGAFLAKRLGFHLVAGPNIVEHRGCFGNALLSRWPIVASRTIDLTTHGREPRGALAADVRFPVRAPTSGSPNDGETAPTMQAIVTHFGLNGRERRCQIAALKRHIEDGSEQGGTGRNRPLLVMGDFNEWITCGPVSRALKQTTGCTTRVASFPSCWPVLPLDRICARSLDLDEQPRRHVSTLSRVASDHLPVRAIFEGAGGNLI